MKKFSFLSIIILISLLLTQILMAGELKFKSKTLNEKHKKPTYEINAVYPCLDSYKDKNIQKKFNDKIIEKVNNEIKSFKKDMKDYEDNSNFPSGSSYDIRYEIINKTEPVLSVKFSTEGYYAGAAHPFHNIWSVNYDLKSGKALTLKDLFKKNSKYLNKISDYCIEDLTKQAKNMLKDTGGDPDIDWIKKGASPKEENFQAFTLKKDSMIIYFNEYQVAPYVMGSMEVTIPYSKLKDIMTVKI